MKRALHIFLFLLLSSHAFSQTLADTTKALVFDGAKSWHTTGALLRTYIIGTGSTAITTVGTITTGTWNGTTIAIANGGSGQTSANAALNAFLPSQTGAANKFLQSDGANTSWVAGGTLTDGDKGDITVSSGATVWTIDNLAVTDAKINDVSWAKLTSGIVPTTSSPTVTSGGSFRIKYDGGNSAIVFDDATPEVKLFSKDAGESLSINNTNITGVSGGFNLVFESGVLRHYDSDNTNYVGIKTPTTGSLTADYTLTLPINDGNTGEALVTDGSGGLAWATVGGSVATDAIWDNKGDLAVGTGANTAAKLSIGIDAKQLYADSDEATGLRWGPYAISPAQITGDQDDYNPTGWDECQILRISGDNGIRAITSLAATFAGDRKTICNIGSYPLYIPAEHPDGTAANRVSGLFDFILYPKQSIDLIYDGTISRWLIIATDNKSMSWRNMFVSWMAGSATAGELQNLGITTSGTGSSVQANTALSGYPGHHNLNTGTTSTGGAAVYLSKATSSVSWYSDAHIFFEALTAIPTLSDGTNRFTCVYTIDGTVTGVTVANNNSCGIRYVDNVNSGKWEGFTKTGGAESTVDLGVTVAAATRYNLRTEIDKSLTEVRFYINGEFKGRVTTNLPTAVGCGFRACITKSVGTTSLTMRMSYMSAGAVYAE